MKKWLLNIWHDLYYELTPPSGEKFAMTCKEAVEQINSGGSRSWIAWFRLKLHLSLCRACRYYLQASHILGRAVRHMLHSSGVVDVEKINQELLRKYVRVRGHDDSG